MRIWPALIAVLILTISSDLRAWHAQGHWYIADSATKVLPDDVPAFFREGREVIASCANDPDLFKECSLRTLDVAESPEHYIDLEYLRGTKLPPTRYAFVQICDQKKLNPSRVGMLPYAITEWTQRLTVAFAEHRRWPEDRAVQIKCLVYAGLLSHYSGDAVMPLHTTVHFDGRAVKKNKSPHSGIHEKVDALPGYLRQPIEVRLTAGQVRVFESLFDDIVEEIQRSHRLVDACYEMEGEFLTGEGEKISERVAAFGMERMCAGSAFTGSLFLMAWRESEKVELPKWVERLHTAPSTQPQPR